MKSAKRKKENFQKAFFSNEERKRKNLEHVELLFIKINQFGVGTGEVQL